MAPISSLSKRNPALTMGLAGRVSVRCFFFAGAVADVSSSARNGGMVCENSLCLPEEPGMLVLLMPSMRALMAIRSSWCLAASSAPRLIRVSMAVAEKLAAE